MWLGFRRLRHPFFPALKLTLAVNARREVPALCGSYEELVAAAAAGIRAVRAVFPIRSSSNPFLPDAERNRLWDLFGVPIYVLLLEHDRVVGFECEAQEGIHLADTYRSAARFEPAACECGRPGARLARPTAPDQTKSPSEQALLAR